MIFEMPNAPGFYLVENGQGRIDVALALLYDETSIKVKRLQAKLILQIELRSAVFFVLWTNPSATNIVNLDRVEFKFWFTDEEDYALGLLIAK